MLWAVALVMDPGAIRHPLVLPVDGVHARLPKWCACTVLSRAPPLNRPQCFLPMLALCCGASDGCLCVGSTGSCRAAISEQRVSLQGRLPAHTNGR